MATNIWSVPEKPKDGMVKGFIVTNYKDYVRRDFGPDVLEEYFRTLTDEERAAIDKDIFATEKVPIHLYYQGYAFLVDKYHNGDCSKAVQMCQDMTEMNINLFFKVMLKFYNTKRLIKSLPKMWRLYTESGEMTVPKFTDDTFVVAFDDWPFSSEIFGNLFMGGVFAFVEHGGDVKCEMKDIRLKTPMSFECEVGYRSV